MEVSILPFLYCLLKMAVLLNTYFLYGVSILLTYTVLASLSYGLLYT